MTRRMAAASFHHMFFPECRPYIIAALESESDHMALGALITCLGMIGDPADIPAIRSYTESDNEQLQLRAICALIDLKSITDDDLQTLHNLDNPATVEYHDSILAGPESTLPSSSCLPFAEILKRAESLCGVTCRE